METPLWADFRSDACTMPTAEMRRAMADAEVGNDDFSEDPTIRRLEERSAALLGKPAALFVQSGTMGNLVALLSLLEEGGGILTCRDFHIYYWEGDAVSRLLRPVFDFLPAETRGARTTLVPPAVTEKRSRILCLENPINRLGGTLLSIEHSRELCAWARRHGLTVHLDGARLFNAACALEVTPAALAECADTVTASFNKALGAPAGAVVAASEEIVARARRCRWMLGGAWKQGGVLAAACLEGLENYQERIHEDHRLARELAEGLNAIPGIAADGGSVATNIVLMRVEDKRIDLEALKRNLRVRGVAIGSFKEGGISRLVTHRDLSRESVRRFLLLLRDLMHNGRCRDVTCANPKPE